MTFPIVSLAGRPPADGLDRKHGPSGAYQPAAASGGNQGAVVVSHVPVNWGRRQLLASQPEPVPQPDLRQRPVQAPDGTKALLGAKAAAAAERPWSRLVADRVRVGGGAARAQVQQRQDAGRAALPRPAGGRDFWDRLGQAATAVTVVVLSPVIVLGALVSLVPGVGALARYGQRRDEQAFLQADIRDLHQIMKAHAGPASVFGQDREAVMAKVVAHAKATGKHMEATELSRLVAVGEAICDALEKDGADPRHLRIGNKQMNSFHGAKAVAWYLMAQAASQDLSRERANPVGRGTSDMVTDGSLVMKDPGHKLFKFLHACPTTYERTSTHFRAQSGHGLMRWNGPRQWGIEDYADEFPGKGGAMLFDALRTGAGGTPTLFVKFEDTGCPDPGLSVFQSLMAARRNLAHAGHFLITRLSANHGGQAVVRQEHVHKGRLGAPVMAPFKQLVRDAMRLGVVAPPASALLVRIGLVDDPLLAAAKAHGLSAVCDIVTAIQAAAREKALAEPSPAGGISPAAQMGDLLGRCNHLLASVREQAAQLDAASGDWGIERRGAEVHVELRPSVHRERLEAVDEASASPPTSRSGSHPGSASASPGSSGDDSLSLVSVEEFREAQARSARSPGAAGHEG